MEGVSQACQPLMIFLQACYSQNLIDRSVRITISKRLDCYFQCLVAPLHHFVRLLRLVNYLSIMAVSSTFGTDAMKCSCLRGWKRASNTAKMSWAWCHFSSMTLSIILLFWGWRSSNPLGRVRESGQNPTKFMLKRDTRASRKAEVGRPPLFSSLDCFEDMLNAFYKALRTGLDLLMPVKKVRVNTSDLPWMTQHLKSLTLKRQKAFHEHGIN